KLRAFSCHGTRRPHVTLSGIFSLGLTRSAHANVSIDAKKIALRSNRYALPWRGDSVGRPPFAKLAPPKVPNGRIEARADDSTSRGPRWFVRGSATFAQCTPLEDEEARRPERQSRRASGSGNAGALGDVSGLTTVRSTAQRGGTRGAGVDET